jgi:hypothetical protein
VIGQRLARNLSAGNTSPVGEYGKKDGIHKSAFLKHIKHPLSTFIHKRNCAGLDTDRFGRGSRLPGSRHSQGSAGSGSDFQKFSAIDVWFQHGITPSLVTALPLFNSFVRLCLNSGIRNERHKW